MSHAPCLPALRVHRSTRAELLVRDMLDAELIARLQASGVEDLVVLAGRMTRCAEDRAARAAWRDDHDGAEPLGSGSPCKSVACSACRQRFHVRGHQRRVHDRWVASNPDNADCTMVTIHAKRLADISDLRAVVVEHRRQLRDLRDARPTWRAMEIEGLMEADWLRDADVPLLPPDRAAMVPSLPSIGSGSGGMWLAHSHIAVHHRGVQREEIEAVLMAFFSGPYRVDVVEFDGAKMCAENAADIIGYGSKARCGSYVGGELAPWPVATRCEWWTAFATWRRGLEPIRLRIGPHSRCAQS